MTGMSTAPSPNHDAVRFAARGSSHFDLLLAMFCVVIVISNVVATKAVEVGSGQVLLGPVQLWPLVLDGGVVLFPLAYVLGDVIAEVYGLRAARRAILAGFAAAVLAAGTFFVVELLPAASWYENEAAYSAVLGPVSQIVLASVAGYLAGQFLNSWVLVRMKQRSAERRLVARLVGSTGVGEVADTLIFCAIAASAIGVTTFGAFLNYFVMGVLLKVGVELALMPLTVRVIAWLKRREPSYYAD
ncbi:queuosine precursor transporter [Aeromicrobium sp. 636]|uniref:Probable queuosine precursor transporter n=1 Tax=Aeromicrobium senzhongii TaxID=2663859 RepID=A0A8I0ESG5_9ACTN|nr:MULTISPECIES: queuosine precursor transporter [Aeromicrobium]MBC9225360.1 queuosine precursor transporter [Aeromicrobium senzhongii]MCQ3997470.1 queuosine precursor transporter [Aeromicrobium sp. 636]